MKLRSVLAVIFFLIFIQTQTGVCLETQNKTSLQKRDMAPTFFLKSLSGNDFFLTDYCGKPLQPWKNSERKIVVISFFATYCLPCLKEIPQLQALAMEFGEQVKFVLVDLKEDSDKVNEFVKKHDIVLPVLLDRYGIVAKKYGVETLPCLFVVDKAGRIVFILRGYDENIGEVLKKQLRHVITQP